MSPLDRWEIEEKAKLAAARVRRLKNDRPLRRYEAGLLAERFFPARHTGWINPVAPGSQVAFLTVANDKFFRGLEALILSLLEIYPEFDSPIHILHDDSLVPFLQWRLEAIYSNLIFDDRKPDWWNQPVGQSANQRRIGNLGYLNTQALSLRGYRRVIILDSDLIIEGGIDPLWSEGEEVRAIADCGDTAYAVISQKTGKPVINSGVLSIPGCLLNSHEEQVMRNLIEHCREPYCPLLDSFADQKVWNQYIAEKPLELLPINFNCNIKYLISFLDGFAEGISIIHFTGRKPWHKQPWVEEVDPAKKQYLEVHGDRLWNERYRRYLYKQRITSFQKLKSPSANLVCGRGGVLMSDCPITLLESRQTDSVVHLIISDPRVMGESWMKRPAFSRVWIESLELLAKKVDVIIWSAYELKEALDKVDMPNGIKMQYILIEDPFSPRLDYGIDLVCQREEGFSLSYYEKQIAMLIAVARHLANEQNHNRGIRPLHGLL